MGVKVVNREYSEIYTNGTTDWLLGNVGEWQKLNLRVEVGIEFIATQQKPIEIDYINNAFILSNGDNWGDHGFDTGMTVTFRYKKSTDTNNDGTTDQEVTIANDYTISNIYGSTMEVEETITAEGFDSIPTNFGNRKITEVIFFVNKETEGCRLQIAHITNDQVESGQMTSLIDGTTTEFQFPGLNSLPPGNFGTMEPIGLQSGMSVRTVKVKQIPNTENVLTSFNIGTTGVLPLIIQDQPFTSQMNYDSIRCFPMTIQTAVPNYQSVANSNLLPQSNSGSGALQSGANPNQAFLFNASGSYNQQVYVNLSFKITSVNGNIQNANGVRVMIARYTNGSSMTFVQQYELQRFENVGSLLNKNLNINGIWNIGVNSTDSLVLLVEFFHNNPQNNQTKSVGVVINGGSVFLSDPNEQLPDFYKRLYEFEIEYMISTMFEDLSNFENMEMPSFLTGDGSITDNFKIKFYPEWNNPNVKIENDMKQTERLGNTGWFNENFNQLPNDFAIDSVEYFDINGNPVEALDYTATTKVKMIISGVQNLGAQTECGFGFAWIPTNEEDFKEKETPFYQNCFVQSGSLTNGFALNTLFPGVFPGAGINGASMDTSNVKFTSLTGKIIFEALFTPNPQFFNLFDSKDEQDRNYILWVSVADGTLTRNFSNRVALLADFKQLVKNIPPAGTYGEMTNKFIEHPYLENVVGEDVLEGIVQDDFLCRLPFRIKKDGSVLFQKMIFGVEAKNIGLNREFVLEKYEVDLTSSPVSNNIQQFNVNQTRGFKLEVGNNKNWVKIYREPTMDTVDFAGFMAFFATKIRYEDWILNQLAPNDFFDANELNTGFNNDWVHYLRTTGWNINFFVKTNAIVNGDLLQYKNEWKFTFNDYDENQNIQTAHRYIRNSDNTLLNVGTDPEYNKPLGVILSNEPTRIEIDFEILDSGLWDINSVYAVTTIEIDRGAGRMEMRQLSSVWGSESDNPLIPIPGETKLKIVVDPTNKILTTKCLVDPDLLDDGAKYRITGRVGCYNSGNEVHLGLYEKRYEDRYE